jgi:hypothetical protein
MPDFAGQARALMHPEDAMLETRRQLLLGVAGTIGLLSSATSLAAPEMQYPPPRPTPPGASNPVTFGGAPKSVNPHVLSQKDQALLKTDLDQLYRLISELLKEYQSTDPNKVLSVSFAKNAEQIEKLAKQVKNLARG